MSLVSSYIGLEIFKYGPTQFEVGWAKINGSFVNPCYVDDFVYGGAS